MQPINYLLQNKNPIDVLFGAVGNWQSVQQNNQLLAENAEMNRLKSAKNEREIQAMQEMKALDFDNETALRQFLGRYGDLGMVKGVNDYIAKLDDDEKQAMLSETSKAISLLQNNRPDLAIADARAKALAYRNSGNTQRAEEYEQIANLIGTDPVSAYNHLMMSYAIATPKETANSYKTMLEANRPDAKVLDLGGQSMLYSIDPITGERKDIDTYDKSATADALVQAQTSRHNSDNSLKGTIYTANANVQRENISQAGENARAQANLNIKNKELQARGKGRYEVVDGVAYYVFHDENGNEVAVEATTADGKPMGKSANSNNSSTATKQQEAQRIQKVEMVLSEIEHILPNATGSGMGAGIDWLASKAGYATKGASATSQLQALSGQLIALMPKMSGPQSDKDVQMYRQMAGKLDDPTLPVSQRQAALETIRRLNRQYAKMNETDIGQTTNSNAIISKYVQ